MAAKRKPAPRKKTAAKSATGAMIISKSRVKAVVRNCNVGSDFYGALEGAVRGLIDQAEQRALANRRKTLRAADV